MLVRNHYREYREINKLEISLREFLKVDINL